MNNVRPLHRSIRGLSRAPHKMEKIKVDPILHEGLTNIALGIWTDCVNAGKTFQDAILAVYLSGLENGASARNYLQKDQANGNQ